MMPVPIKTRKIFSKKNFSLLIALALLLTYIPFIPSTEAASLGNTIGVTVGSDSMTLTIDNGTVNPDILELNVLKDALIKLNYRPSGAASDPSTPMIDPNQTWDAVGATIDTSGDPIVITTSEMRIEIAKTPTRLTVKKADGTTLLWEATSGGVFEDGVRFMRNSNDNIYGIRSFNAQEDVGSLLRNDSTHPAHAGKQGDSGGPFIWSTAGYGLLVDSDGGYPYSDTTGKLEFYYGGEPEEGRRYFKNNIEYYIMLGEPTEIMKSYADITGETPMLPKWSLGFMNFEWGINQTELENHVDTYRANNIPIDAYALDYDWMKYGETNNGEFTWNTTNFPDASSSALKNKMDALGINLIGIRKPRIATLDFSNNRTSQYYTAETNGYFYPGHDEYQDYFIPVSVRSIDHYNPSARSWWWQNSIDAFDKGIVGWWNDETDKVDSWPATYWFGNYSTAFISQSMYEGQRDYTNDGVRVWQTARSYYPGAQRYATTLWSGDIGTQFYKGEEFDWAPGMQEQPSIMLSSTNLGQMKWGMDTGGFNSADKLNPSPELYTRWMQFGAFTSVFRVHGNYNQQRQPWYYGTTAEEMSKAVIQERYSLLPYMYYYERQAYEDGVGLVKPLLFDYPNDPNVADYTNAWMFGDYLLVSPVLEENATSHSVYLPSGTWIDYYRGTVYSGDQTIHYPVNADTWSDIPIFIKAGAIIPTQQVLNYVDEEAIDTIYVDIFPTSTTTNFTYYDDDGSSYDYENSNYFKQEISAQANASNDTIIIQAKSGTYNPDVESYISQIHGRAASNVTVNSSTLPYFNSLYELEQASGEGWTVGNDLYGPLTYVKTTSGSTNDKTIVASGITPVAATASKYEAEKASLSGETTMNMASVNTNHTGYSEAGFVDKLDVVDAAVSFYSNVQTGGQYDVSLRYANGNTTDRTMSIYVNGERIKTSNFPITSNWASWSTITESLPLSAGQNVITVKYEDVAGDTGGINLDYITVPFNPTQALYEAESALLLGTAGVNQNHSYYSGYAFADQFTTVGAEAAFDISIPETGSYNIELRYANGSGSTKTINQYVDGSLSSMLSLSSPSSSWDQWTTETTSISLSAGTHRISYKYDTGTSGNINIDRIVISKASASSVTPYEERNLIDNGDFERPTTLTSKWYEWVPTGQASAFGVNGGLEANPPQSAFLRNTRAYFHSSSAYQQSLHQLVSVPTNNTNYTFEARVRMQYTTPTIARAEVTNYGGTSIYYDISNDGVWNYIKIENIYVTNGQVDVGFYVNSPGNTVLQIDDVRVTKQ